MNFSANVDPVCGSENLYLLSLLYFVRLKVTHVSNLESKCQQMAINGAYSTAACYLGTASFDFSSVIVGGK